MDYGCQAPRTFPNTPEAIMEEITMLTKKQPEIIQYKPIPKLRPSERNGLRNGHTSKWN